MLTEDPPAPGVSRDFARAARSAGDARAWVRATLSHLADPDALHDLEILVTETVTNSYLHTNTARIRVHVIPSPDLVRIEVLDDGSGTTKPHVRTGQLGGGHGLGDIVEGLSDDWGVIDSTNQTSVWFVRKVRICV